MKSPLNQGSLGALIKAHRKNASLTQEVAAMLCGVTKKTLIRVEKGEDVYISTLFKILDGLGINIVSREDPTEVSTDKNKGNSNGWY
jgi:transcriptional regulator with XRE-family HTH domain